MPRNFVIRLADINIGIAHRYRWVRQTCDEYIVDDKPEFIVSVTAADISAEQKRNSRQRKQKLKWLAWHHYEATSIYREICLKLLDYDAFLLHATVVVVNGDGYAFLAKSGTGKTTHAKFWLKYFGDRAFMVNGDKLILRIVGDKVYVYETPWCGKANWNTNVGVPLKAILFLERGQGTMVTKMPSEMIPERIASQLMFVKNREQWERTFALADRAMGLVPMYRLICDMNPNTAMLAWQCIRKIDE